MVQRAAHPAPPSNAALLAEYNHLRGNSATFLKLDNRITSNGTHPVTLVDGSATQDISYNQATHAITVPVSTLAGVAHPLSQVRADLLWEMHNAMNKGAHQRMRDKWPGPLGANATRADRLENAYQVANFALSNEWVEWSKLLEAKVRAETMQGELGGAAQIDNQWAANLGVLGASWYQFENYLNDMIASGHTGFFDPLCRSALGGNPNHEHRQEQGQGRASVYVEAGAGVYRRQQVEHQG